MTVRALITEGVGPGGTIPFLLTGGLGIGRAAVVVIDTHDGHKKKKRWDEETEAKTRRRAEILHAFEVIVENKPEMAREIAAPFVPSKPKYLKTRYELPDESVAKMVANAAAAQKIWEAYLEMDDEEVLKLL